MSEFGNSLDKPWIGKIYIGTLVVAVVIWWDFKYLPYWLNILPFLSWIASLVATSLIWTHMKRGTIFKILRPLVFFVSTALTIFMILDRFGDFSNPEIVPARVTQLYKGNFLALSSWGVDAIYPDGTTIEVGGGHYQFDFTPTPGMMGKAVIGRGLFGVRYIERLEFDPNAPHSK